MDVFCCFFSLSEVLAELLFANGIIQRSIEALEDYLDFDYVHSGRVFDEPMYRLRISIKIAEIYMDREKYQTALDWFMKAAEYSERKDVDDRTELVIRHLTGRAYCHFEMNNFLPATLYFELVDEFFDYCPESWKVLSCNLLRCIFLLKNNQAMWKVVDAFQHSMMNFLTLQFGFSKTIFLDELTACVRVHSQLGLIHELMSKPLPLAENFYLDALKLCEVAPISCHPVQCDTLLRLAKFYWKQTKVTDCETYVKKSLLLSFRIFGPNDENVRQGFEILTQLVDHRKDIRKASTVFTSYMNALSRVNLLDDSEFTASFCFNFAQRLFNHINCGQPELAKCNDLFSRSWRVFTKVLGSKNAKTAKTQKLLGICNLKLGNVKVAEWHLFNAAVLMLQSNMGN